MPKNDASLERWNKTAADLLVGKKIKSVSYMDDKELDAHMWERRALVIELEDGTCIYPSADDEGNDAGVLFTTSKEVPALPALR